MTLGESLRTAARNLINMFGNSASRYAYSSATKTTSNEGDVTVTNWGTATSIKVVEGDNYQRIVQAMQGIESIGADEKIIRDDATVVVNDRITSNSVDSKIIEIRPIRAQDVLVAQAIRTTRVTSTTAW